MEGEPLLNQYIEALIQRITAARPQHGARQVERIQRDALLQVCEPKHCLSGDHVLVEMPVALPLLFLLSQLARGRCIAVKRFSANGTRIFALHPSARKRPNVNVMILYHLQGADFEHCILQGHLAITVHGF